MKKMIVLLLLVDIVFMLYAKDLVQKRYVLNDAIQAKKVTCQIRGNDKSTHYLQPIIIQIENKENQAVAIDINNGDMFIPEDSLYQNIIVTHEEHFVLQPKELKSISISGMCTEQSDKAGHSGIVYHAAPNANDTLKKLANFLQQKSMQSSCGQYAMWCLANNNDINSVYSSDSTEENKLKEFIAKLTGKTYILVNKNYTNYYFAPPKEKVSGKFNFNFSNPSDIQIALFNKNGILVRELYNQKNVIPREHQFQYAFDASVYTEDIYFVKFIADGEVFINREWNVKAIRDKFKQKVQDKLNGQ